MKKILVTGVSGQLGYDVVKWGSGLGFEMLGISSTDVDITQDVQVLDYMERIRPHAIIHCAAYTAVDKAEDDRETCWDVNVNGTRNLVKAAKSVGAKFMYISTDYVFDGKGTNPFVESDEPNPIGYYGETKFEGEKVVQELSKSFIVRISWVFGINGNNFIKTMLRLAETREELNVVGDQFGSPTYTYDLAKLLLDMIQSEKYGLYHATNEGFCSWAEFAKEIFNQADKNVMVHSIATEEYPTRAIRPKNSRLSKEKLVESGFEKLPSWQSAVSRYLKEIQEVEGK